MKMDLHVHTTASPDGLNTPRLLIKAALRRGLSGVAVTDHNTNRMVAAVRAAAPDGFMVIAGVEYSTDCGHVLALFCEDFAADITKDARGRFKLAELSPFVRVRGGLLVAAHPFSRRDELPEALLSSVDGLESVNARELSRNPASHARVEAVAAARGLFLTGGADAHVPMEIGGAYTVLPGEPDGRTMNEVKDALLNGLCRAEGKPGRKLYWAISRVWKKLEVNKRVGGRMG